MMVRVRLVWKDAASRDDDLDNQLLLDIIIDKTTRIMSRRYPLFGVYGSPLRDNVYPFILHSNGRLDFGNALSSAERFNNINIGEKPIQIGEYVTYQGDDDEWTCKIVDVMDLSTGQPV